ncbi:MAG TPA: LLM class flavin-dependent oxidoreductase [Solirubrobacterales bacterium]|nr:LLM class flavin-dependent oxidoreductase [Solirubrobacterales bacterium]
MSRPAALERVQIAGLGGSLAELGSEARAAEAAGVDCVWAVELYRSSFTQAMWLAAHTDAVGVGTGIAWAFTRSPMIIALESLDADEASGGRFRLGLGAGVKRLNETWHGVEYGRPAPHLRETIEVVRLIVEKAGTGEPIRFEGDYHEIDIVGWARPLDKVRDRIPIYTAAVQEGMARMAGDVADGMIGHPVCSLRWLDEVLVANFERGLSRSGRDPSSFDFLPSVCCAIDDEEEAAYDAARRTICFYATVRTYRPLFEMHGFGEEAAAVGDAFRRGDFASMPGLVSDEMVDTYCAAGPVDKVRERVEAVAERGDGIWLGPPTYFIAPQRIAEYQRRIVEEFAPGA